VDTRTTLPVTRAALIAANEAGSLLPPALPGVLEFIDVPGVRGRITPIAHPLANLVGQARLRDDEADAIIRRLCDLYGGQGKPFGWYVGPNDTPTDLGQRLLGAGFRPLFEYAGLALTDLATPIRTNPAVRVEEIDGDAWRATNAMRATAFGVPLEFMVGSAEVLIQGQATLHTRFYVAYVPEQADPVAFSQMMDVPGTPIVNLGGAATLPDYRGRGIYTSLVARRLADARAAGRQAAVIQAMRHTSAPICQKLGFDEVCGLAVYAWQPG
jgi:hypothetical protein